MCVDTELDTNESTVNKSDKPFKEKMIVLCVCVAKYCFNSMSFEKTTDFSVFSVIWAFHFDGIMLLFQ